jgi:Ca2+-binding RTX toxin-like protein
MPVFALYNLDDTGSVAVDSSLVYGAQNGGYFNGASSAGGRAVLDGVDDKVKIYPDTDFQMTRGTLEIQFSQTAHVGTGSNTILSRDSAGETAGGYRIEVQEDGSILISHESAGDTTTFQTDPGFVNPGDEINIVYSWDEASGGSVQINNLTTSASFDDDVPAGLTMDQGATISQPWMIGVSQELSDPAALNNLTEYFQGSVEMFSLSDTVDNGSGVPDANPDTVETDEDTSILSIPVLANDTDPTGQTLTIVGTPTAGSGTVAVNPDGTLSYTPDPDFNGTDTITYTITDPDGNEASSTVTVTVNPVNDAPIAVDDSASGAYNDPVVIDLIANDTDVDNPNATLTISGTPTSPDGVVVVNPDGRSITFTPTDGFVGDASISYTVTDPDGLTDDAVAVITIEPLVSGADGVVRGTDDANLIDDSYVDPFDTDLVDASDAFLGDDEPEDDRIRAEGGDDTVFAGLGNDTVFAGTGDDEVYGGVGDDDLRGNEGEDRLYGGDGSDTVYGQEDSDFIDTSGSSPLPDIDYPGLYGADADPENDRDLVYGGLGDDTILTGDDADTIYGDGANDLIDAGFDADLVYGGVGDDTIIGSEGADTIYGESGADLIYGGLDSSVGDALDLPDDVDLRPLNNTDELYGGDGDDTIYGHDDNDVLEGGDGNDLLYGGVDNDLLLGDAGDDTLNGDDGDDTLQGGAGNDLVNGGDGDDLLQGNGGDDTLNGDDGEDILQGGAGSDVLDGGAGDDFLQGGADDDTVIGGEGDDVLEGNAGNDRIDGGAGADTLYGFADRDDFVVRAGEGAGDSVFGGADGDDFDRLIIQGGRDTYRVIETGPDSDGNGIDGRVEFLDAAGAVTGTLEFENIEEIVPCFTPGTLIATPKGEVPVESLKAGDRIITRDNGIQELRWIGQRGFDWAHMTANPHLRPVMIRQGSLGNGLPERDMMVSPNHRVLVSNERTSLYFDEHEVLVAAKHLIGGKGIFEVDSIGTTYLHLMFDQHEVVLSDGAWTESFQPGDYTLNGMGNAQRTEILELFPELKTKAGLEDYTAARRTLKKHEASLLARH